LSSQEKNANYRAVKGHKGVVVGLSDCAGFCTADGFFICKKVIVKKIKACDFLISVESFSPLP